MLLNLISRKSSDSDSEKSDGDPKAFVTHYTKSFKREDLPQKFKLIDCLRLLVGKQAELFYSGFNETLHIKNNEESDVLKCSQLSTEKVIEISLVV